MDDDGIEELFQSLGRVEIRRMFGGKGVYHHDLIFALEVGGEILLKADEQSADAFREAGSKQWVYESGAPDAVKGPARKKPVAMPYWSIPDEAVDDPDAMARWARLAYEAAIRAQGEPKKKSPRKRASSKS